MKKIAMILALCLVFSLMAGCSDSGTIKTETYNLNCGATITALAGLDETPMEGYTTTLDSRKIAVFLLEEDKPAGYHLADYADLVVQANGMETSFAEDAYGNLANSYVAESEGEQWFYYVTVVEGQDSFWLCQFICRESERSKYEDLFGQWSATLEIPGGRVEYTGESDAEEDGSVMGVTTYELSCGMEILAPEGLETMAVEGITEYYANALCGFAVIQEEKYEGYTLADYADAICQVNGYDAMTVNAYGDYCTEHVYDDGTGNGFWYYTTVHETETNFYMLQIFCYESEMEEMRSNAELWSSTFVESN